MSPESLSSDTSRDQAALQMRVQPDSDATTLRLAISGEVDGVSCTELQQTVTGAVRRHRPAVVEMDVGGVTFLDSAGIKTLLECRDEAGRAGCDLVLVRAPQMVHRVLEICGLLEHFGLPPVAPAEAARSDIGR
jgi:anti-anti-sigma factor